MAYEKDMGADDDMYSDAAEPTNKGPQPDKGASDETEAVLPKSILAGKEFNVGDEVVLKITAMRDDQISVKYAPAKPDEDKGEEGDKMEAEVPEAMAGGGGGEYD